MVSVRRYGGLKGGKGMGRVATIGPGAPLLNGDASSSARSLICWHECWLFRAKA